ncbi:MAG: hypothetical protein IJU79_03540 [Desulfovibrionaceae bacterium]|nr:hypothetical protein [Desulfovibrionaceae bacterium]
MIPTFSWFLISLQSAVNLLWLLAQAAMGLPVILGLTLLLTRRGHVELCLEGASHMSYLLPYLACFGPVALASDVGLVMAQLSSLGQSISMPSPLEPALLPYTLGIICWIFAITLALIFKRCIFKHDKLAQKPNLKLRDLALSLITILALILLFFTALLLPSYPLAGLPEGLSMMQALQALLVQTEHQYFYSIFPAAIMLLLFLQLKGAQSLNFEDYILAQKWLAALGLVGGLPHVLNNWGIILGYILRSDTPMRIWAQFTENSCLSISLVCLASLLFKKFTHRKFALCGALVCLLGGVLLAAILLHKRHF